MSEAIQILANMGIEITDEMKEIASEQLAEMICMSKRSY